MSYRPKFCSSNSDDYDAIDRINDNYIIIVTQRLEAAWCP